MKLSMGIFKRRSRNPIAPHATEPDCAQAKAKESRVKVWRRPSAMPISAQASSTSVPDNLSSKGTVARPMAGVFVLGLLLLALLLLLASLLLNTRSYRQKLELDQTLKQTQGELSQLELEVRLVRNASILLDTLTQEGWVAEQWLDRPVQMIDAAVKRESVNEVLRTMYRRPNLFVGVKSFEISVPEDSLNGIFNPVNKKSPDLRFAVLGQSRFRVLSENTAKTSPQIMGNPKSLDSAVQAGSPSATAASSAGSAKPNSSLSSSLPLTKP